MALKGKRSKRSVNWVESKHPRDSDGKFARKGSARWLAKVAAKEGSVSIPASKLASGPTAVKRAEPSARAGALAAFMAPDPPRAVKAATPMAKPGALAAFMAPDRPSVPATNVARTSWEPSDRQRFANRFRQRMLDRAYGDTSEARDLKAFERLPSWETDKLNAAAAKLQRYLDEQDADNADRQAFGSRLKASLAARGPLLDQETQLRADRKRLKKEHGLPADSALNKMEGFRGIVAREAVRAIEEASRTRTAAANNKVQGQLILDELAKSNPRSATRQLFEPQARAMLDGQKGMAGDQSVKHYDEEMRLKLAAWDAVRGGDDGEKVYDVPGELLAGLDADQRREVASLAEGVGIGAARRLSAALRPKAAPKGTFERGTGSASASGGDRPAEKRFAKPGERRKPADVGQSLADRLFGDDTPSDALARETAKRTPVTPAGSSAATYKQMKRSSLLLIAKMKGITTRNRSNDEIAEDIAAADAGRKPEGTPGSTRSGDSQLDTPRVMGQDEPMTTTEKLRSTLPYTRDVLLRALVAKNERKLGWQEGFNDPETKEGLRVQGTAVIAELETQGLITKLPPTPGDKHWEFAPGVHLGYVPTDKGRKLVAETTPTPKGGTPRKDPERQAAVRERLGSHETSKLDREVTLDEVSRVMSAVVTGDQAKALGFEVNDRPIKAGDEVMVSTFDKLRGGIVVEVGTKNVKVAYTTPTGGHLMTATRLNEQILRKVRPTSEVDRQRLARTWQKPKPAPRLTAEERAAAKEQRDADDRARRAEREAKWKRETVAKIRDAEDDEQAAGILQLTIPRGVREIAREAGVKIPRRDAAGGESERAHNERLKKLIVDTLRADRREAERERQEREELEVRRTQALAAIEERRTRERQQAADSIAEMARPTPETDDSTEAKVAKVEALAGAAGMRAKTVTARDGRTGTLHTDMSIWDDTSHDWYKRVLNFSTSDRGEARWSTGNGTEIPADLVPAYLAEYKSRDRDKRGSLDVLPAAKRRQELAGQAPAKGETTPTPTRVSSGVDAVAEQIRLNIESADAGAVEANIRDMKAAELKQLAAALGINLYGRPNAATIREKIVERARMRADDRAILTGGDNRRAREETGEGWVDTWQEPTAAERAERAEAAAKLARGFVDSLGRDAGGNRQQGIQAPSRDEVTAVLNRNSRTDAVIEQGARFSGNPLVILPKYAALSDEDWARLTDEQRDNVRFVLAKLAMRDDVGAQARTLQQRFGTWGSAPKA